MKTISDVTYETKRKVYILSMQQNLSFASRLVSFLVKSRDMTKVCFVSFKLACVNAASS